MSEQSRVWVKRLMLGLMALIFLLQFKQCMDKYTSKKIVEEISVRIQGTNVLPPINICVYPGLNVDLGVVYDEKGLDDLCPGIDSNFEECIEGLFLEPMDQFNHIINTKAGQNVSYTYWVPNIFTGLCLDVEMQDDFKATLLHLLEFSLSIKEEDDLAIHVTTYNKGHYSPAMVVSDTVAPQDTHSYHPEASFFYDYGVAIQDIHRLNTDERPCVDDKDYKLYDCIQRYIFDTVQCSSKWIYLPAEELATRKACSSREDFDSLIRLHHRMIWLSSSDLINLTQCPTPCKVLDFEITRKEWKDKYIPANTSYISFYFTSTDEEVIEEVYFYDFNSLIGEVGGSLGLFLGFSFLTVFDVMSNVCQAGVTKGKKWMKYKEDQTPITAFN